MSGASSGMLSGGVGRATAFRRTGWHGIADFSAGPSRRCVHGDALVVSLRYGHARCLGPLRPQRASPMPRRHVIAPEAPGMPMTVVKLSCRVIRELMPRISPVTAPFMRDHRTGRSRYVRHDRRRIIAAARRLVGWP